VGRVMMSVLGVWKGVGEPQVLVAGMSAKCPNSALRAAFNVNRLSAWRRTNQTCQVANENGRSTNQSRAANPPRPFSERRVWNEQCYWQMVRPRQA